MELPSFVSDPTAPKGSGVGFVAVDYRFDYPIFAHVVGPYRFVSDLDLLGKLRAVTIVRSAFPFVLIAEIQYLSFVFLLGCDWLD